MKIPSTPPKKLLGQSVMPFVLNITPTERATHASVREPSAFAEVTSEEREALQNKPTYSGFAVSSFSTTNATPKKWAFQKSKPSSSIWPSLKMLLPPPKTQAFSSLLFLYHHVLEIDLGDLSTRSGLALLATSPQFLRQKKPKRASKGCLGFTITCDPPIWY
jgi:hypothetical protein